MRILAIIIVVVLGLAAGGHYLLWQQQSKTFENGLDQAIADFNRKQGSEMVSFSYDSKETGGYPTDVLVRYTNPVLTILPEAYKVEGQQEIPPSMIVETIRIDGTLTIRNAFLQNQISAELEGSSTMSGKEHGEAFAYKTTWEDVSGCTLTSADEAFAFVTGEDRLSKVEDVKSFIQAVSAFDCETSNMQVSDVSSGEPIATLEHYNLNLTSEPSATPTQHQVGGKFQIKGLEMTSSKKQYVDDLKTMLAPLSEDEASFITLLETRDPLPILDGRLAGKQYIGFQLLYDGPLDEKTINEQGFSLDIQEFALKNDLYSMSFPLKLVIKHENNANNVSIRHEGLMNYTAAYDEMLQQSVDIVLGILKDDALIVEPEMREKLLALDADAVREVIPSFHKAGDIRSRANIDVDASKNLTVESAGVETALFGLTAKGTGNPDQLKADMQIICTDCRQLVAWLSHSVNQAGRIMLSLGETQTPFMVTDEAQAALYTFLQSYDTDQAEETITLTLTNGAEGQINLSGKPIAFVMIQALSDLGPHFKTLLPQPPQQ